jgi:hypothetical protein
MRYDDRPRQQQQRDRERAALLDYLRRHGRAHRHDGAGQRATDLDAELGPLEHCFKCNLPLVEGATAFDPNPAGGGPRRWWCRSCALLLDDGIESTP